VIQNIQNIKINNEPIFYIDSDDPVISHLKSGQLFGYGNWLTLNEFIIDNDEDSFVVDCGAHIGTFSFVPAMFYDKKMILIDGAKNNFECLQKTFHGKSNVELYHSILLDGERNCNFSSDYGPFGSASNDPNGSEKSTTLDAIVKDKKIAGIKFDIEGNEPEALIGSLKTLKDNKPPLLIEVNGHCLRLHQKFPKDLFNVLDTLDYSYFIKNDNSLIRIDKNEIFPFCVLDIVCIHKDNEKFYNHLFDIKQSIPVNQLVDIAKQNYRSSNQDCKNYFDTLNLEF
jgi:FkbM family methyltransferase